MRKKIVIDTNVLIAALRSRNGASFKLLENVDSEQISVCLSVPLVLEYEEVALRLIDNFSSPLNKTDIFNIINYLCKISLHYKIFYLWRPFLKDPKDDMILELAVVSNTEYIVTHNIKDFAGCEKFGIKVINPKELLKKIGVIK